MIWVEVTREKKRFINLEHVQEVRFDEHKNTQASIVFSDGRLLTVFGKDEVDNLKFALRETYW